jgi:hypothetical protein
LLTFTLDVTTNGGKGVLSVDVSPCVLVWLSQVRGKRSWQWWQKNVIAPIILVGLGALYSACLMLDRVEERFVIFRSYITLNDASNRKVSDASDFGL